MNDATVVKAGGASALAGVAAGLAGAIVGAVYGLGGQEIPLGAAPDFASFVERQSQYLAREWLFLLYVIFGIGEGIGLYFLTRRQKGIAFFALVAFSAGILIGIVQDAAVVGFVRQFPTDYRAADAATRLALEPLGRTIMATIGVQQALSNILLGIGVALYSTAVLRLRISSKWFGMTGIVAALSGVFFGVVTAATPHLAALQPFAEHAFGLVVLWDLWAGVVMLRFSEGFAA